MYRRDQVIGLRRIGQEIREIGGERGPGIRRIAKCEDARAVGAQPLRQSWRHHREVDDDHIDGPIGGKGVGQRVATTQERRRHPGGLECMTVPIGPFHRRGDVQINIEQSN